MTPKYNTVSYERPTYLSVLAWGFWEKNKSHLENRFLKVFFIPDQRRRLFRFFLLQTQQRLKTDIILGRSLCPPRLEKQASSITSFFLNPFSQEERM